MTEEPPPLLWPITIWSKGTPAEITQENELKASAQCLEQSEQRRNLNCSDPLYSTRLALEDFFQGSEEHLQVISDRAPLRFFLP